MLKRTKCNKHDKYGMRSDCDQYYEYKDKLASVIENKNRFQEICWEIESLKETFCFVGNKI